MENEREDNPDSIRFIWNATPSSKLQQARSVIHPAFHYTPLANQAKSKLEYTPLFCSCEAVLNKFCTIDYNLKTVRCCFCQTVTPLPQAYVQFISPKKLPYEFMPENSTFEYKLMNKAQNPPKANAMPKSSAKCLLFVLDLCILEK